MRVGKNIFLALIFSLGLLGVFLYSPQVAFAATRTWDGGGTDGTCGGGAGDGNKWSCAANWSSDIVPVAGDTATFNGTSTKNATIDQAFTLVTLTINAGYTGIITQVADLTLAAGNFTHNTTDGTFTWTSGTLSFTGGSTTWDVDTGDDTFGAVTINKTTGTNLTVTTGDTAIVTSTLTLTDGNINTGTVEARGDVVHGAGFDGGTGTLNITQGSSDINLTDGGQLPTVNLSATRNMVGNATGTVTFDGNFAISGGAFVGGAGNLDLNGTSATLGLSIVSPGAFTAPSGTMFLNGGYSHVDSSTFTHNSGTVSFDGPTATLNLNTTETFNHVTWNPTAGIIKTVSTGDTLIVLGTLTLAEGNIGTGTVDARGDVLHGAGFDGGTGTLASTAGSTAINLTAGGQLPNINLTANRTINGAASGTITFDGAVTIAGGSFVGGAGDIDMNGNFTLSSPGTFTAPSGNWFMSGNWTHTDSSVFAHNSGTVIFDGNESMNCNVTETLYNVTINPVANGLSMAGTDILITEGLLSLTNGTIQGTIAPYADVVQAATFDGGVNTGGISFGNDAVAQTYTVNGGIGPSVVFDDPDDANDSLIFNAAATMRNINIRSGFSGNVPLVNASDFVLTFEGWNQQAGYYDASAQSQWITNDMDATGGTFIAPQLLTFTGGGNVNVSVDADPYLNNVTINKTSGTNFQIPSGSNLTVHGNLNLTSGGFHSNNNVGKGIVEGNVTIAPTFESDNALLEFSGSGNQIFDLTGATGLFDADIRVDKSGGSVSLASALVMNASSQDLIIVEGTLDLSGQSLTVNGGSGTLTVQDGGVLERYGSETITLNAGQPSLSSDSTVRYTGDGDAVADTYTVTALASTYGNLEIASTDGATDTFQLGAPIVLNGDLNLTSGLFDVTASNHAILVHGDWNNTGTFNPRTGTVTFNGDHTLSGTTTFYNFTDTTSPATLTFPAGLTQTITNTLTLAGSSGASMLSLRSSIPGTQAKINPQGSRTLQYLNVQDNDNDNVLVANCVIGCITSGNNENWFFGSSGGGGGIVAPANLEIETAVCSAERQVAVELTGTNVQDFLLSEDPNFLTSTWTAFTPQVDNTMTVNITLSPGDGDKTLYARFRSNTLTQSGTYIAQVSLDEVYACLPHPEPTPEVPATGPAVGPVDLTSCTDREHFVDAQGVLKAGAVLLKFAGKPEVYTIENDANDPNHRILRWLSDENTAVLNFGSRWSKYVLELPEMTSSYSVGEPITSKVHSGTVEDLHARAAITGAVSYELSIVTPDGVRRDGSSNYARHSVNSQGIGTYYFEDKTDFDYNDVVLMLDPTECLQYRITALPIEAKLHSQVWLKIFWEGQPEADILVFSDSQDAVTNIATINSSNDILMNGQVKIEIKNGVNAQLFRPLSFIRNFWRSILSLR